MSWTAEDYMKPSAELLATLDARDLLLQCPPFVFVDGMEAVDIEGNRLSSHFTVREGGVFVSESGLEYGGMMENMAQTMALRIGYVSKYILNEEVRPGVLVAVRGMKVYGEAKVGERVVTEIVVVSEACGYCVAVAVARVGERVVAEGELRTLA